MWLKLIVVTLILKLLRMPSPPKGEICYWRANGLPLTDENYPEEGAPHPSVLLKDIAADYYGNIMFQLHEKPPKLWMEILNTRKLFSPAVVWEPAANGGNKWLRFECRHMRPISAGRRRIDVDHIFDMHGRRINADQAGTFTMWKCVPLTHLARPCIRWWSSNGILNDGGMRYGSFHHADGIGVYADACPRFELFSPWEENVLLELRMHANITEARDGTPGRHVLKSEDQSVAAIGADCTACEVVAVFVLDAIAPVFAKIG